METTLESGRGDGYVGAERGHYRRHAASRELANLIADVEELAARLVDAADPEIARLRAQVERTVAAAKESLGNGSETLQRRARQVAGAADDYVRHQPWSTLGVVALVAMAIGFIAARR